MRSVDGGAVPVVLIQYPSASIAKLCHCGYPPAKSGANAQSQDGQQGPVEDDLQPPDRKSTRLNSSHSQISYAVFCLKKTNAPRTTRRHRSIAGEPKRSS